MKKAEKTNTKNKLMKFQFYETIMEKVWKRDEKVDICERKEKEWKMIKSEKKEKWKNGIE